MRGVGQTSGGCDHDEVAGGMVVKSTITRPVTSLFVLLLAAPLAVEAQQAGQAVHTVGVLTPHGQQREYPAFVDTLRQLGYHQDRNGGRCSQLGR